MTTYRALSIPLNLSQQTLLSRLMRCLLGIARAAAPLRCAFARCTGCHLLLRVHRSHENEHSRENDQRWHLVCFVSQRTRLKTELIDLTASPTDFCATLSRLVAASVWRASELSNVGSVKRNATSAHSSSSCE
jgi:hypothetical protein